jgi:hypothetical protein
MDMTWLLMPTTLFNLFAFVGLLNISYYVALIFKNIAHRIRYGKWQKDPQEYKLFLVLEENVSLKKKISDLEQENTEILNSIIDNFKG